MNIVNIYYLNLNAAYPQIPVTPTEGGEASITDSMSLKISKSTVLFFNIVRLSIDLQGKVQINNTEDSEIQKEYNG